MLFSSVSFICSKRSQIPRQSECVRAVGESVEEGDRGWDKNRERKRKKYYYTFAFKLDSNFELEPCASILISHSFRCTPNALLYYLLCSSRILIVLTFFGWHAFVCFMSGRFVCLVYNSILCISRDNGNSSTCSAYTFRGKAKNAAQFLSFFLPFNLALAPNWMKYLNIFQLRRILPWAMRISSFAWLSVF